MTPDDGKEKCTDCGRSSPVGSRFCIYDGTAIGIIEQLSEQEMAAGLKMCLICKRRYPNYAIFCSFDATRLAPTETRYPTGIVSPSSYSDVPGAGAASMHAAGNAADPSPAMAPYPPPSNQPTPPPPPSPVAAQSQSPDAAFADSGDYNDLVGKTIDNKYQIESVLGEGGMAVVYRANQIKMDRMVVIKIMQGWLLSNKSSLERFEREAILTARLNHPNIVQVYDNGRIGAKRPYLVMEYIKGETLADKISRQGSLPLTTAGNILGQICRGLQEAHNIGIVHRDLKPENILLQDKADRPDWVKIVDFGISHLTEGSQRLTRTGKMIGTPEYIAPEQLRDRALDIRTDIYALGIIFFEMLTGQVPFSGETAESILMKHLLDEPPKVSSLREDVPDDSPFAAIIEKALRKNPDERYQTVTELRLDIERAVHNVFLRRG